MRLATDSPERRCGVGALAIVVLLLASPHRGHAQCVVEGTMIAGDVRVDRGDGRAITIQVHATPVAITIPPGRRRPLQIDVRGPLAFSGETTSHVLALRPGTYAGGAIEIDEDGRAPIASARSDGDGVRVALDLDGVTVRDVVVPCGALTTFAPHASDEPRRRRVGGVVHPPSIGTALAARGPRLDLRAAPDSQSVSIVVTGSIGGAPSSSSRSRRTRRCIFTRAPGLIARAAESSAVAHPVESCRTRSGGCTAGSALKNSAA